MKRIVFVLCATGILNSISYAESITQITFDSQNYPLLHVESTSEGCGNNFGVQLQADIESDPINALVSVNFNIFTLYGSAQMTVINANGNKLLDNDALMPLGLSGKYAFASFHNPEIEMLINGHSYKIFTANYTATGKSSTEWISDGVSGLAFINPEKPDSACGVYSSLPQ